MFVIEVIPLKRGISAQSLSYYSALEYKAGSLVTIPLRSKETVAVVTGIKPVSAAKTALKTATFSLRRLPVQNDTIVLPQSLLDTAFEVSKYIPASMGSILFAMLPPKVRTGELSYPVSSAFTSNEDPTPQVLTDTTADRYITYRSHIRETFAHRGSVLFVVPTSADVEHAQARLEKGIENRVITFSSAHSTKKLKASFEAFADLRHAKLIITTPSYAFLDRHDLLTIIIESSGSTHYHTRNRPYFDVRDVLKTYAKKTKRSIILGDLIPRTEDEIRRRDEVYATFDEHKSRLELPGSIVLTQHKKREEQENFSLFTDELIENINRTVSSHGHVFVHAARKGLAPVVICFDCGYIFRCPDSGAPYSLLRTFKGQEEQRWFFSSTSGKKVRASDVCPECGSWRLREQGIGIQQVVDQVHETFPQIETLVFDHTTATTHTKAQKIAQEFYASKRAILVGTTMALSYLDKPVDTTAVVSYEALRTVPTWRADEVIFSQLIHLRELTLKDLVIQLRTEPDELLQLATKGLLDQFYDGEIAIRNALHYPPFNTFILLSFTGDQAQVLQIETQIQQSLEGYEIQFYNAPQLGASVNRYGLMRIPEKDYPDAKLLQILRALPPYIKIEIDPERIV